MPYRWHTGGGKPSEIEVDILGAGKWMPLATVLAGIFGEIWCYDSVLTTTLNNATGKVQFTHFSNDGAARQLFADHANNDLVIQRAGLYLVTCSIGLRNEAAQTHTVDLHVYKNAGATALDNLHTHRTLSGGSTDIGSISLSGITRLEAGDTLELWFDTDAAGDRVVTAEDVSLSAVWIGP